MDNKIDNDNIVSFCKNQFYVAEGKAIRDTCSIVIDLAVESHIIHAIIDFRH